MTTVPAFASSGGGLTGYAPLMMNNYVDSGSGITWGTAIEGRMAGTGTVRIDYYTSASTSPVGTQTYAVGSDHIFRFDQRNNSQVPTNTLTAAKLTGPSALLFKVNVIGDANALGDAYGTYKGISQ